MNKERRQKQPPRQENKLTLRKYLIYRVPLILIMILVFFMAIQKIGELLGIFPIITLGGTFYGEEAVIFFILSLSLSIFLGLLVSFLLHKK